MSVDEFQFLKSDAASVQRLAPVPAMTRITKTALSGRSVSVLTSSDPLARGTTPFVFLHGAGLNAHTFDPTIMALEEDAFSLDLPGHGRSDWRDDADYSPFTMAEDVASVIRSLTKRDVHLVGQSLGGLTAAAMIRGLRNRLASVTLIDVTPGIRPDTDAASISDFVSGQRDFASIDEMVNRAIEFGIGDNRAVLTRGVTLNSRQRPDGRFEWSHHFAHLDSFAVARGADLEAQPFVELWEPLATLGARVRLIRGSQGIVTDAMQSEWRNRLPEAEIHTLDAGHNVQEQAAKQLGHILRAALVASVTLKSHR